ncbi:MAG: cell division protein ZapA [Alphaproteobacteria bacterium]
MANINVTINGRSFGMECDDGQQQRVIDLAAYVDAKIKAVAASGAGGNENHNLVLTALMLADEVFDARDKLSALSHHADTLELQELQEQQIAEVIDTLAERIDSIAERMQTA